MEIMKTLVLSTAHITRDTLDRKGWPWMAASEYGSYYEVPEMDIHARFSFPDDLHIVLKFAEAQGCQEVKFDRDVAPIKDLPTYEWL